MTDVVDEEIPAEVAEAAEGIEKKTKKGFDLKARLEGRGLRRASITLYLDEELGPQLGWDVPVTDLVGNEIGRNREGAIGKLADIADQRATAVRDHDLAVAAYEDLKKTATELGGDPSLAKAPPKLDLKKIDKDAAEAEKERDALLAKLTDTGLTFSLRAVPQVIYKDCRRRAKLTLKITKGLVPDDQKEEFQVAMTAHLMTVIVQTVTDNETGEVNTGLDYEEAVALMDWLPVSQYRRLDQVMGKVQLQDAISSSIESQEDFS